QVAAKVGFAHGRPGLVVRIRELRDDDVRVDTAGRHRAPRRCVVTGDGQPERAARGQFRNALDRSLAEAALAHDDGTAVVLQAAEDNLGRGTRADVVGT